MRAHLENNGADERLPAGASVSIRFDGSRCFRARHQDRRASAPMARAKRGPSRESRAAVWRVAVDAQVGLAVIYR